MLLNIGEFNNLRLSDYLTNYSEINRFTLNTSKSRNFSKDKNKDKRAEIPAEV